MPTIIIASASSGESWTKTVEWPVAQGPLHLGISHHLVARGMVEFLIVARGVLAGKPMVGSAVATLTAPSPQSGGLVESKVEGPIAHALNRLGLSALVVIGRASHLAGLVVAPVASNDAVEWVDSVVEGEASVWHTDEAVRGSVDDVVLATGKWGMAQHYGASIVANRGFPSAQGGLGAVMGAMNLKYIVLRSGGLSPLPSEKEKRLTSEYEALIDANPLTKSERDYPGFALWPAPELHGYAASGGFSSTPSSGLKEFSAADYLPWASDDGAHACPGCPQACLKAFSADAGHPIDGGRAHQIGMASFALHGNNSDPETAISFNALCHKLGLEHLVAEEALRGEGPLSPQTLEALLDSTLSRTESTREGALRIKNMPLPPFDPRGNQGLAVGLALNPTGPRYDVLEHDIDFDTTFLSEDRVSRGRDFGLPPEGLPMGTLDARRHESLEQLWLCWSALDALGICEYAAPPTRELTLEGICSLVSDHMGAPFTRGDLFRLGKVRLGLLRATNAGLGLAVAQDTLPDVFFDLPIAEGLLSGVVVNREEFQAAAKYLFDKFEWDEDGLVDTGPVAAAVIVASQAAGRLLEGVAL
jgi:aldehyde:ferredoxin oxidoreductase